MFALSSFLLFVSSLVKPQITLAAEVLALRQQLFVLQRTVKRPPLRRRDRFFWVMLSQLWQNWREALIIVQPETVVKWHREGFRLYWHWKSKTVMIEHSLIPIAGSLSLLALEVEDSDGATEDRS